MIRLDSANWIKTGVEYTDGLPHFSAVVTRDFSVAKLQPSRPRARSKCELHKVKQHASHKRGAFQVTTEFGIDRKCVLGPTGWLDLLGKRRMFCV